ncbi:hypothetical protein PEL8287_00696 [Roseovarius litorisediminis]|uniref:HD domain-containing protein n=1 Tax=Roseovarius litorisediminis TaxID=1312363 RepID=A0A1Y5RF08_9RHOB|nr:hypothetical protein [Roseovarius litorisediminis]SLN15933.1 hypothetical protein PEL8287_00696 [Roseovarius litorisediminis]
MMSTLGGQKTIREQLVTRAMQPEDWLRYIVALLVHDIGLSRGFRVGDTDNDGVINEAADRICPLRGAPDAFLASHHIYRGKIYARHRFLNSDLID